MTIVYTLLEIIHKGLNLQVLKVSMHFIRMQLKSFLAFIVGFKQIQLKVEEGKNPALEILEKNKVRGGVAIGGLPESFLEVAAINITKTLAPSQIKAIDGILVITLVIFILM